jgi:hypothetical protein
MANIGEEIEEIEFDSPFETEPAPVEVPVPDKELEPA